MLRSRTIWLAGLFALAVGAGLGQVQAPAGRAFAFPSGGSSNVTVLDAGTLANVGTIAASPNAFQVVGTPDGSKYYVIANNSVRTITVVNAANLAVLRQIDLGVNASAAVVTGDGRRLLVSAGRLRIFDTANDTELVPGGLDVGAGPVDIQVSNDSARAYVMSTSASVVSIVNLSNNTIANQASILGPVSMALLPNAQRLIVLSGATLSLLNPNTGSLLATAPLPQVVNGKLLVTPDSTRALVVNLGFAPQNTPLLVDLASLVVTPVGSGVFGLDRAVVTDNTTAYGIVNGTNGIARIDLTTGAVTLQNYGANTRGLEVSPSGKSVYLASFAGSSIQRVDVTSNLVANTANIGVAPQGVGVAIPPATQAANIELNGGNRQNLIAGQSTQVPLSVRVTASDGNPAFNVPVTFASADNRLSYTPAQPSRTNSLGIAQAQVSVAAPTSSLRVEGQAGMPALQAATPDGGGVKQFGADVQIVNVTATAPGTGGVTFTLTIGTTTGLVAVSGSYQITRPSQPFPLPVVARVTNADGFPPPAGTPVTFSVTSPGALPPSLNTTTDVDGLVKAQFSGSTPPPGFVALTAVVVASVDARSDLGNASFYLQSATTLPGPPEVLQGDMQSADVGQPVPNFLGVTLGGGGAFQALGFIGVYWEVVAGPAGPFSAILNPTISLTNGAGQAFTQVTIGPRAGTEPIIIKAFVPGIPGEARFTLRATGGPPEQVIILQGNNQDGRPGQTLAQALRVRVLDLFGNRVPLPNARYPLFFEANPPGSATTTNFFQQPDGEASVLVTIANNYVGPLTMVASAGNGRATFNLRSIANPASIVQIAGNNLRAPVGGTSTEALVVRVNDAQGIFVPGATVTFSGPGTVVFVPEQGNPANPLTLTTGADGRASARIRINPGTPAGNLSITATVPQVTSTTFTVIVLGRAPTFTAAGVVDAASNQPGLVPGGLGTLFGTGFSEITGLELPGGATSHRGVVVRVEGQAVPLYAVSNEAGRPEQINFQVRTDLGAPATIRVEVENNGSVTGLSGVQLLRVRPAIFEYTPAGSSVKHAAAVKLDGSVVGPNNRLSRGEAFMLFVNSMGPTQPPLQTGQVGPVPPATSFFQPTVGIGGRGQRVLFSGIAPGLVISQINVEVGQDAPSGEVELVVIVEGVASQSSRIAIQ